MNSPREERSRTVGNPHAVETIVLVSEAQTLRKPVPGREPSEIEKHGEKAEKPSIPTPPDSKALGATTVMDLDNEATSDINPTEPVDTIQDRNASMDARSAE